MLECEAVNSALISQTLCQMQQRHIEADPAPQWGHLQILIILISWGGRVEQSLSRLMVARVNVFLRVFIYLTYLSTSYKDPRKCFERVGKHCRDNVFLLLLFSWSTMVHHGPPCSGGPIRFVPAQYQLHIPCCHPINTKKNTAIATFILTLIVCRLLDFVQSLLLTAAGLQKFAVGNFY